MTENSDNPGFIFVVGGPCGCGKSSVGATLGNILAVPFTEGDELHPKENVEKMSHGIPLTDDDRWGWLKEIAQISYSKLTLSPITVENEDNAHKDQNHRGATNYSIVGCSSLKKSYRDYIAAEVERAKRPGENVKVVFVFLNISIEESKKRVLQRKGHYMKPNMVNSQFAILETPAGAELLVEEEKEGERLVFEGDKGYDEANAVVIEPDNKDQDEVVHEIVSRLKALKIIN